MDEVVIGSLCPMIPLTDTAQNMEKNTQKKKKKREGEGENKPSTLTECRAEKA